MLGEPAIESQGRILELYAFPLEGLSLKRAGVSFKDIAERCQIDTLLKRNHDTFVRMIENAPFGVYVVNEKLQICQVSKQSLQTFKNIDPLIGRDFGEVMHILWYETLPTKPSVDFVTRSTPVNSIQR